MNELQVMTICFCGSLFVCCAIIVYSACITSGRISQRERERDQWN